MCAMGEKIILLPTVFEEMVVVVEVGYLFKHGVIFSIFTENPTRFKFWKFHLIMLITIR